MFEVQKHIVTNVNVVTAGCAVAASTAAEAAVAAGGRGGDVCEVACKTLFSHGAQALERIVGVAGAAI